MLSLHSVSIKLGTALGLIVIGYLVDIWGFENAWYLSATLFLINLFIYLIVRNRMMVVPEKKEILVTEAMSN